MIYFSVDLLIFFCCFPLTWIWRMFSRNFCWNCLLAKSREMLLFAFLVKYSPYSNLFNESQITLHKNLWLYNSLPERISKADHQPMTIREGGHSSSWNSFLFLAFVNSIDHSTIDFSYVSLSFSFWVHSFSFFNFNFLFLFPANPFLYPFS